MNTSILTGILEQMNNYTTERDFSPFQTLACFTFDTSTKFSTPRKIWSAAASGRRLFLHLCFFHAVGVARPRPLQPLLLQPLLLFLLVRRHVIKALLPQMVEARACSQRRCHNRKQEVGGVKEDRFPDQRSHDSPSSISQCSLKTSITAVRSLFSGFLCTDTQQLLNKTEMKHFLSINNNINTPLL